jgi:hypothetical protein
MKYGKQINIRISIEIIKRIAIGSKHGGAKEKRSARFINFQVEWYCLQSFDSILIGTI